MMNIAEKCNSWTVTTKKKIELSSVSLNLENTDKLDGEETPLEMGKALKKREQNPQ